MEKKVKGSVDMMVSYTTSRHTGSGHLGVPFDTLAFSEYRTR